jgi:histidine ammonia-lyase
VHALLRQHCPAVNQDRALAADIERATALVTGGALSAVFHSLHGLPALWTPG